MASENSEIIWQLAKLCLQRNYDYFYLHAMLEKAKSLPGGNATLITGSSHALNAIYEPAWEQAVNCSMHSQDIYYDFQCAKAVLSAPESSGKYSRCFIIMGYYIAFQDLSLSTALRESWISNIYYPLFHDAHNWETPTSKDLWADIGEVPEPIRALCEKAARLIVLERGTYYSDLRRRGSFFDMKGRTWAGVSAAEREAMGKQRAQMHNHLFKHTHSFEENKRILREYVRYLYAQKVMPIVVITPFTREYNQFVLPEMKQAVLDLVDSVPEDVQYVDCNEAPIFEDSDFMDTDHMSLQGAQKVSAILADMFGR